MLRIRIDPRTVMNLQNQIPNVIIAIILCTFSYAISALMGDTMWAVTYVGVNTITNTSTTNPTLPCGNRSLNSDATQGLLQTPFAFVESIFALGCGFGNGGLWQITTQVSGAFGGLLTDILNSFFNAPGSEQCTDLSNIGNLLDACISQGFSMLVGFVINMLMLAIIFIVLIVTLFRIWFELLKAYIQILIYTITGPLWIVIGLLPKKPLGFERWLRGTFVNYAIFPATVLMLLGARIFFSLYNTAPQTKFIPPLVGNPTTPNFGVLAALGMLLMAPTLLSLLREKLSVPQIKQAAAIGAGIAAGAGAAGALPKKAWQHSFRRNPQNGAPIGLGASLQDKAFKSIGNSVGGKFGKRAVAQKEFIEEHNQRGTKQELNTMMEGQRLTARTPAFNTARTTAERQGQHFGYSDDEKGLRRWDLDQQTNELRAKGPSWRRNRKMRRLQQQDREIGDRGREAPPTPPPPAPQGTPRKIDTIPTPTAGNRTEPAEGTPQPTHIDNAIIDHATINNTENASSVGVGQKLARTATDGTEKEYTVHAIHEGEVTLRHDDGEEVKVNLEELQNQLGSNQEATWKHVEMPEQEQNQEPEA